MVNKNLNANNLTLKNRLDFFIKFLSMGFYYQTDKFVLSVAQKYDQPNKKLLDIGAGDCPYKKYFKNLEAKRAEAFAIEASSGGFGADLAKLEEQGIEPSIQLKETFSRKNKR